jgi:hypothetical protein
MPADARFSSAHRKLPIVIPNAFVRDLLLGFTVLNEQRTADPSQQQLGMTGENIACGAKAESITCSLYKQDVVH